MARKKKYRPLASRPKRKKAPRSAGRHSDHPAPFSSNTGAQTTASVIDRCPIEAEHPAFLIGDRIELHLSLNHNPEEPLLVYRGAVVARFWIDQVEQFTIRRIAAGKAKSLTLPVNTPRIAKIVVTQVETEICQAAPTATTGGRPSQSQIGPPKRKPKKKRKNHTKKTPQVPFIILTPRAGQATSNVAPCNDTTPARKLNFEDEWAEKHLDREWWR